MEMFKLGQKYKIDRIQEHTSSPDIHTSCKPLINLCICYTQCMQNNQFAIDNSNIIYINISPKTETIQTPYNTMLFGRLLQANSQNGDAHLTDMQRDLRNKIQKAKNIAINLKLNPDNQDQFVTSASGQLIYPQFRTQMNYNQQFWKTYLKNQLSFALIKQLSQRTTQLQQLVKEIQTKQEEYFKLYKLKNRKKNRRLAVQIEKKYQCPYERCYKFYGSDVSLNLHIKIKHNGGNKTDREKLAQEICLAQINGTPIPEMRLNLPPGYLQEYKKENHFAQRFKSAKEQPREDP